jgi:hypothetical protein
MFRILLAYLPLHDYHFIIDIKRRAQRVPPEKPSEFRLDE